MFEKKAIALLFVLMLSLALAASASASVDLQISESDITIVDTGTVLQISVTVHNTGTTASGSFVLRIGVSKGGSTSSEDHTILSVPSGLSVTKVSAFNRDFLGGCAWGRADYNDEVTETDETNNYANINDFEASISPGGSRDIAFPVVNPNPYQAQMTLTAQPPTGWTVTLSQTSLLLAPDETVELIAHFEAPAGFTGYEIIPVIGEFQGGVPGIEDWCFHMTSTVPAEGKTWGAIKALYE